MEPRQRNIASILMMVGGVLLGAAAVTEYLRSGEIESFVITLAVVALLIGLRTKFGRQGKA